jgi:hypothetical protein
MAAMWIHDLSLADAYAVERALLSVICPAICWNHLPSLKDLTLPAPDDYAAMCQVLPLSVKLAAVNPLQRVMDRHHQ